MSRDLARGWRLYQHAWYAAPRARRGGPVLGMQAGIFGAVLRAMIALMGEVPWLPVGDADCRVCRELGLS